MSFNFTDESTFNLTEELTFNLIALESFFSELPNLKAELSAVFNGTPDPNIGVALVHDGEAIFEFLSGLFTGLLKSNLNPPILGELLTDVGPVSEMGFAKEFSDDLPTDSTRVFLLVSPKSTFVTPPGSVGINFGVSKFLELSIWSLDGVSTF